MKQKLLMLYSAMQDKRTPWYAKAILLLLVAYIVSPIDIIPDFIPVFGLLDEAIIIPLTIGLVCHLIPEEVKNKPSTISIDELSRKRFVLTGVVVILASWMAVLIPLGLWLIY